MLKARDTVAYRIQGALMNTSVPRAKVTQPSFPFLGGVDGRFSGGLRKFYGMKEVLKVGDVSGMGLIDNSVSANKPYFFKPFAILKTGTSTIVTGFVIAWDYGYGTSDLEVDIVYTENGGSSWTRTVAYNANTGLNIASTDQIDVESYDNFLYICAEGQDPQVWYYDSSWQRKDMGPGAFSAELGAQTLASSADDSSYYLRGDGTYQVAYRLYDSTRNIYSALSARLTITLDLNKLTKATGYFSFSSAGGDSGLMIDGDVFTVGSRTYEADDDSSYSGNVQVDITGLTTIAQHCQALADAINGDSSQTAVTARAGDTTVFIEAASRGAGGNSTVISISETGASTDDISASGATLTGGGDELDASPVDNCKATIDFPANTAVVGGQAYANFAALFDTVEVFRSINLTGGLAEGAILYKESEVSMPGSSGAWDSLQVTIGESPDDALPFATEYNPEEDIVTSVPTSGVMARYQGLTFMSSPISEDGGLDFYHSSAEHQSPEYFSTFNNRKGSTKMGRVMRLLQAGDSLFGLCANGVVHIYKASRDRPLQYIDLHMGRGVAGYRGAHSIGSSVMMLSESGLMLLSGADGNMGQISVANGVAYDRWRGDLSTVQSGFDASMNASFFLHPGDGEIMCVWHGTQAMSFLYGANFVCCADGLDPTDAIQHRTFFMTGTGIIVTPDEDHSGSGTMWGCSNTVSGTVTSATTSSLTDSAATFNASILGAYIYFETGNLKGQRVTAGAVSPSTTVAFTPTLAEAPAAGDQYVVSPVPFFVHFPRLVDPDMRTLAELFNRWIIYGAQAQFSELTGFSGNFGQMYVGVYRNGSVSAETGTGSTNQVLIEGNPSDVVVPLTLDGIGVEPYLRILSVGTDFYLNEFAMHVKMTGSMNVSDNS